MKTIIEIAHEANEYADANWALWPTGNRWKEIRDERFATLVRAEAQAEEREACVKVIESHGPFLANGALLVEAIRARGNT